MRKVHLVGIGGVGMVALAGLLKARGWEISGSEAAPPYPPASEILRYLGIKPRLGYRAENLLQESPSAVVIGNVIRRDNPEAQAALGSSLPVYSLPSALAEWILPGKKSLVVAGTHGKTTTTALLAYTLEKLGSDPLFMVGGLLRDRGLNFRWGKGPFAVLEGDEYDSAFFDKTPKFWHYQPFASILTGIEYDHADIYPDYEALLRAFRQFVKLIPKDGLLVFWGEDPGIQQILPEAGGRLVAYGLSEEFPYHLRRIWPREEGLEAEAVLRGRPLRWYLPLWGKHNALNALAVLALLTELGFSPEEVVSAWRSFPGVSRRQEVLYQGKVTVVDDFAHHPTAVEVTLKALREARNPRRLVVCFEPRTNTSKRKIFFEDYLRSLSLAERVILKEPPGMERLPAFERLSLGALAQALRRNGRDAEVVNGQNLLGTLTRDIRAGDMVVFMSSASFGEVYQRLVQVLKARGF